MNNDTSSSTAFTVVQGIVHTAKNHRYSQIVPRDQLSEYIHILNASREGQKYLRQIETWWGYRLLAWKEKLLLPGIALHYVLRKRCIEEYLLKEIKNGVTQVVNLGAGLDTLSFRLSKQYPGVRFIEIDHPATQATKRQALHGKTDDIDNLHFLPVDFEKQKLSEVLGASSCFNSGLATLYIVEGVLMYLSAANVKQLLKSLTQLSPNKTKLIFTAVEPSEMNMNSYGLLFRLYLKFKNEPLLWTCKKEGIEGFLAESAYTLCSLHDAHRFKQEYLASDFADRLQASEYVVVAESGQGERKTSNS